MNRPTFTRTSLALLVLAACGGRVPDDTRAVEADPVALSESTLPTSPELGGTDTAASALPAPSPAPMDVVAVESPAPDAPFEGVEITIRPGENLVGLASVADLPVEMLVDANGLDPLSPLTPGETLRVPLSGEAGAVFLEARDFARADRLDHYLAGRGGLLGVETHVVRTGETAWGIARHQAGVPTWVLSAFNPDTNLDMLGIGQRVKVPVFGDSVAEAAPEEPAADTPELDGADIAGTVDEVVAPRIGVDPDIFDAEVVE